MTPTTGDGPHPEVAEISDLTEGLLTDDRAARLRAHIAGCPLCADVVASLAEIRELLGSLPEPEPMPDDVIARLDAALAVEAGASGGAGAAGAGASGKAGTEEALPYVPRGTSLAESGEAGQAGEPTPTQEAARTEEAARAGESAAKEGVDVPRETSAPVGRPSAPTRLGGGSTSVGGGRSDHSGPGRDRERQRRRRRWLAAVGSLAGVLILGGLVTQLHPGDGAKNDDSAAVAKSDAGADAEQDSSVGSQVRRLLAGAGGRAGTGGVNSPMLGQNGDSAVVGPGGSTLPVPRCVLQATERSERPLAAQRESFQGTDSYLVVLPDTADSTLVDAFVISAACPPGDSGLVLFQQSYPRG